jgi:hypothetical protein
VDEKASQSEKLKLLQEKAVLIATKIFTITPTPDESIAMFHKTLTDDTPKYLHEDVLTEDFLKFVDETLATAYIATYSVIAAEIIRNFSEEQIESAVKICSDPKWDHISKVITKVGAAVSNQRRPLSEAMAIVLAEFKKRIKLAQGPDFGSYVPPLNL